MVMFLFYFLANYSPGLLEPTSEDLANAEESVGFFNLVGASKPPASYSAVKEGWYTYTEHWTNLLANIEEG